MLPNLHRNQQTYLQPFPICGGHMLCSLQYYLFYRFIVPVDVQDHRLSNERMFRLDESQNLNKRLGQLLNPQGTAGTASTATRYVLSLTVYIDIYICIYIYMY